MNLLEVIEDALTNYVSQGYQATLHGHLIFPGINWSADPAVVTNVDLSALVELTIAWNTTQIVSEPTREDSFLDNYNYYNYDIMQFLAIAVFCHQ